MGFLKKDKGTPVVEFILFILFLEFNHQNKYFDQISWSYRHFYGNYGPLLFEPILVQYDVILSQNGS